MTLLTAIRRIFRRSEAVDAAPGVETTTESAMIELGERLAIKRGDNVTTNSGDGHDTTIADIAEIYDILKPRLAPEFA